MVLEGLSFVGFADLRLRGLWGDFEDFVVVYGRSCISSVLLGIALSVRIVGSGITYSPCWLLAAVGYDEEAQKEGRNGVRELQFACDSSEEERKPKRDTKKTRRNSCIGGFFLSTQTRLKSSVNSVERSGIKKDDVLRNRSGTFARRKALRQQGAKARETLIETL